VLGVGIRAGIDQRPREAAQLLSGRFVDLRLARRRHRFHPPDYLRYCFVHDASPDLMVLCPVAGQ
jgi:hypothetical protein